MMKKKSRRSRSSETLRQTATVKVKKRMSGRRPRPQRSISDAADTFKCDDVTAAQSTFQITETSNESKSSGRLSTAVCRLCHGKFSPRSLRHAFIKWPRDSLDAADEESVPSALLFHSDFQQLVGVQVDRDPRLSDFICKKCHAKFYKCHSILVHFLQRVNLPPVGTAALKTRKNTKCPESSLILSSTTRPSFTSDPEGLHSLVSWAHHHGESCSSCPDLKEVLEGQCWGSLRAVWGCVDGHQYVMDAQNATGSLASNAAINLSRSVMERGGAGGIPCEEEQEEEEDSPAEMLQSSAPEHLAEAFAAQEALPQCPAALEEPTADSDLSDRVVFEEEFEESREGALLSDALFEPYSEKRGQRATISKRRTNLKVCKEPKVRKKPGPKPGWKNKFKPKVEELPNIYKCPYQGCTAVYRAPDGLKKHIKEHHEEVRERPCPHPGCNKVFMIDRYLQRHVKLIHTEVRNYICDQCGQTFKQRKHLSVHQMRHSGAKPLQCEVCGFQCRQRASLKYHMTKHKAEADLDFECSVCRKRFEKAHNLNVHMSMVHPLTLTEVPRAESTPHQQQREAQKSAAYAELHTITLTGEVIPQEQER